MRSPSNLSPRLSLSHSWTRFAPLFLLVLLCNPSRGTGPSNARVVITPLAANDIGTVIFKTSSHMNKSGTYTPAGTEYGWLCASSTGIWEERVHLSITEDHVSSGVFGSETEAFNSRVDLRNPPPSLQSLMESCDIQTWHTLDPFEGKGRVVWQPDLICVEESCSHQSVQQRSLGGLFSIESSGTSVENSFYHHGLAIFENLEHYNDEQSVEIGAKFHIENLYHGQDIGMNYLEIAAIGRIPPNTPSR